MAGKQTNHADKRRKWAVLSVTDAERATITANANEAGISISAYLINAALAGRVTPRGDWQRIAHRLGRIEELLDFIAALVEDRVDPCTAGLMLLALVRLEGATQELIAGTSVAVDDMEPGSC